MIVVFLFYFIYSIKYSANPVFFAKVADLIQQMKPFAFFFFSYTFCPEFSGRRKSRIRFHLILASLCYIVSYLIYGFDDSVGLIWHPFVLGISAFSFGIAYYYYSSGKRYNILLTIFILTLGLFSLRSKFFGEYVIMLFLLLFVRYRIRFNMKYVFGVTICTLLITILVIQKFTLYFIQSDNAARFVLYSNMPNVLIDYFPFGSGLASYATHISGEYYSPLYYKYGLENCHGMSPDDYSYIADTYFPVLAEFGVAGIFLFSWFWWRRYKEIDNIALFSIREYRCGLAIFSMIIIESVAGPVLVMNWGLIPLYLLGVICRKSNMYRACL